METAEQNLPSSPGAPPEGSPVVPPPFRGRRFASRDEAQSACTKLDTDRLVPLEPPPELIGEYIFPEAEWVTCQLVDATGRCRQNHGHGFIAHLPDGTQAYIGHRCAKRHFKADQRFNAAVARLDREITTNLLVSQLRDLLDSADLPKLIAVLLLQRQGLEDRVLRVRSAIRPDLLKKLTARAKSGNSRVTVRIIYEEEEIDERTGKSRKVPKPQEVPWGALGGLEGLNLAPIFAIGKKLQDARSAAKEAVASADQPIAKLRKWMGALEYPQRAAGELSRRESMLDNFCAATSLKHLWLLIDGKLDQIAAARAALEILTRKAITDEQAATARDEWAREIRDAYRGREFQIVG